MNRAEPWWEADKAMVAGAVVARAEQIRDDLSERYEAYERAFELYSSNRASEGLRQNVIAEATDALAAELTQSPIRVVITARAVDYDERQAAKLWEWYADAAYVRHRLPALQYLQARDAIIAGIGAFVVVDTEDGPKPERVHPCDLLVDDAGCVDAEPPELVIQHLVSRHRLAADYPEHEEAILEAPCDDESDRDALKVYTAWFEDKRKVVALRGVDKALYDDKWEGRPPWGYVRVVPPERGLVGHSLVLRAESQQLEHDRLTSLIQDASIYAVPWLFYQQGSVDPKQFENEPNRRIATTTSPREAVFRAAPEAVHPENYARLQSLRDGIFRTMQANDLFAGGEIPNGLGSGTAIRNYREVRSRRHKPTQRELEWGAVQLVKELVRGEQRAMADGGRKVEVQISGVIKRIPLSDMLTDEDQIQMQARPASALAIEPSGQIEQAQEAVEADVGFTREDFFELTSDVIDFEKARRRITASSRFIESTVSEMLKDGLARKPEKFIDKQKALQLGLAAYMDAQVEGCPEERLAVLRGWLDEVAAQIADAAAPPPMPAGPMPEAMPPPGMLPEDVPPPGGNPTPVAIPPMPPEAAGPIPPPPGGP